MWERKGNGGGVMMKWERKSEGGVLLWRSERGREKDRGYRKTHTGTMIIC